MIGINKDAADLASILSDEDREFYQNYADGVNFCVENMKVYPPEFYILWTDFEPWTVEDSIRQKVMMDAVSTFDHYLEIWRDKLAKVYDIGLVSEIFPFRLNETYWGAEAVMMDQEELKRMNFYNDETDVYHIPNDLLSYP